MKRQPKFLPKDLTLLDLTLEDREVLLDDEQGLISLIADTHRQTDVFGQFPVQYKEPDAADQSLADHQPIEQNPGTTRDAHHKQYPLIVYTDDDLCLYFMDDGGRRSKGPQSDTHFHFLDTTELPDWQGILRYLHWEQHGLNSLGDE